MPDPAKGAPPERKAAEGHVSVIYFHGMGEQRRYEETSRLIDAVDAYSGNQRRDKNNDLGMVRTIKPKVEPHNLTDGKTITYINTEYGPSAQTPTGYAEEVRYYEAYWAPIMADASSGRKVTLWILSQCTRPWVTLSTVWRERQRLRRSALADLADHEDKWPNGIEISDFDALLQAYDRFGKLDEKRENTKGNFTEFAAFVQETHKGDSAKAARLDTLARAWVTRYRTTEYRNLFFIASILLSLALLATALGWFTLKVLAVVTSVFGTSALITSFLGDTPTLWAAIGFSLSALSTLGLGKVLANYMGDVEAWSTYQETNSNNERRKKVMAVGTDLMKHVLADDNCKRVVIVSHSLGTSVAHDTLLALRRENLATNRDNTIKGPIRLDKIYHFVTMASPIDKINYFFESYRSDFHRYAKVVEELRGDISDVPFTSGRHPYTHWVNFYDEADIISGSLQSPVGTQSLAIRVDNVHVANLHFPHPGTSHSSYFNNRSVISKIFAMAYWNEANFDEIEYVKGDKGKDYSPATYGPGTGFGHALWVLLSALLLPWLCLCALVLWWVASPLYVTVLWGVGGLVGGITLVGLIQSRRGHRDPL